MDKVFEHANDLHVRAIYIYKKESDTAAYVDAGYTVKFKTSALKMLSSKAQLSTQAAYYPNLSVIPKRPTSAA